MSPFVQPLFHYLRLIIHYELGPVLLCFMVVYDQQCCGLAINFLVEHRLSVEPSDQSADLFTVFFKV